MSGYIGTTPTPQATQTRDVFTATAGQTSFATSGYSVGFLDVYVNGSHLKNGTDYTASNGSDVVMASGLAAGDYVEVVAFTTFSTSDTVSASGGGTFSGDVSFGDSVKAKFGAGSDLQIYHNGSASFIDDAGNGYLNIQGNGVSINKYTGETMALFVADGAATLYHDNSSKLATSSYGVTVTGSDYQLRLNQGSNQPYYIRHASDNSLRLHLNGTGDRVTLDSSGRLGVGTSSPSSAIHAVGGAGTNIGIQSTAGSHWRLGDAVGASNGTFVLYDYTNSAARLTVNSSGNVGIGTTSANTGLSVVTGSANGIELGQDSDSSTDSARLFFSTSAGSNVIHSTSGHMRFFSGSTAGSSSGTERMRLNSSGNLLVGKTAVNNDDNGLLVQPNGNSWFTATGNYPLGINRKSTDGALITFTKDQATVGRIGANGGNLFITGASAGIKFGNASAFVPTDGNGTNQDNTKDIGSSSVRFDDIYATNSSIQTSDRNEKQNIASLTSAEITAAKAISQLFKTYKWNSSVESKGDNARTHTGVIAQEVEAAMSDAGLDAGNYAFFISTTWWETSTEVAAVEADEENSIEAQEAYISIETYNTADEAPEGAVERNRKGIRYPELLSFIGAATEQRLTSIEARLDTLEAG